MQHFDNFYDLRHRFFICIEAFRKILSEPKRSLTWVADRGLYSLSTFQRIMGQKDHFITWEKNYKHDGWNERVERWSFVRLAARNNAEDLRPYTFCWQEHPWHRDPNIRRVVVRAKNPNGNEIEVVVLASDLCQEAGQITIPISTP